MVIELPSPSLLILVVARYHDEVHRLAIVSGLNGVSLAALFVVIHTILSMLSITFNADDLHRSTAAATRQEVRVVEVANTLFNRPHLVG